MAPTAAGPLVPRLSSTLLPNLMGYSCLPSPPLFPAPPPGREEGEKFNVWVAWLNLENAYGSQPTPEKAAMDLLKRALQYTDHKKMYLAALGGSIRTSISDGRMKWGSWELAA